MLYFPYYTPLLTGSNILNYYFELFAVLNQNRYYMEVFNVSISDLSTLVLSTSSLGLVITCSIYLPFA